jgi:hypothetical protein
VQRNRRNAFGWIGIAGLVLVLALLDVRAALAQRVDGQLRDADTNAPIAGAALLLLDGQGGAVHRVQSDARGLFSLRAPQPGVYRIQASRLGYRDAVSRDLDLTAGTELEVDLRLSADAVRLEPLTVTGIPRYDRLEESGFYERRDHFGPDGLKEAVFLEQHDIERMNAFSLNDIFHNVRGVRTDRGALRMRGNCTPAIVVNGFLSTPGSSRTWPRGLTVRGSGREISTPRALVGVEVYYGMAIPARYLADAGGCGVIMYWTK